MNEHNPYFIILKPNTMKIGYARVSTKEQNLAMQLDLFEKEGCEMIFEEKISTRSKKRPELENMLKVLRDGDEVIVFKLDRLGRSLHHMIEIVNVFRAKNVSLRSVKDNFVLDYSPVGKMMFHVFGAIAEFERDMISERTRAGLAAARARGRVGGRPRGLSKEAQNTAAAAKTLYLEGVLSIRQICKQLSIAPGTLYSYLRYMNVKVGSKCTRT